MAQSIRRKPLPTRSVEPPVRQGLPAIADEDLWGKAVQSIDQDIRDIIRGSYNESDNKTRALELVARESRERRKQCLKQRWRIKKRNGEVVILRDVFEKIMKWVDRFKAIGNLAVSMAPGYASIPWGAVCVLLKVAIDENEGFVAMIEGLEKVTRIIPRYTTFEIVYLQRPSVAAALLKSALVTLYASILTFLGKACHYFGQGSTKRFFKSLGEPTTTVIEDLLKTIETNEKEAERTGQIVGMELLHQTSQSVQNVQSMTQTISRQMLLLNNSLDRIQGLDPAQREAIQSAAATSFDVNAHRILEPLNRVEDLLQTEARRNIFDWLSSFRYWIPHQTEKAGRLPDSGKWMFDSIEYRSWLGSSASGTLWLHGMPGCGKTKLASAVIDAHMREAKESLMQQQKQVVGQTAFAFFYCSRSKAEPERSNPEDILRCIARQLCGDNIHSPVNTSLLEVFKKLDKPRPGEYRLPMKDTVDLILQVLASNPAVIVIDALDECEGETRFALFESLDRLVSSSMNVVKVFLTSRNDGDIVCRLASTPNIYINAQSNKSDIERFTYREIHSAVSERRMLNGRVSSELQHEVMRVLNHDARGMFRWVSLQVQNLCDPRRMKIEQDVLQELGKLPKSLSELYSIAFSQILDLGRASRELALSTLQLLLTAARPLPWAEMLPLISASSIGTAAAIASKDEVLDVACNFLEDDVAESRPRIIHTSAREYLETRPEFEIERANAAVAGHCLAFIEAYTPPARHRMQYPYLYLTHHLAVTTVESRLPLRESLNNLLQRKSPLFDKWRAQVNGWAEDYLGSSVVSLHDNPDLQTLPIETVLSTDPLFSVCALGLAEYLAVVHPNQLAIQRILPGVASVGWSEKHLERNRYMGKNCLHIAIMRDRIHVVAQLLKLHLVSPQNNADGDTPLHVGVKYGSLEMVRLLLSDRSLDVNATSTLPYTASDSTSRRPVHELSDRSSTSMGFRTYGSNGQSGISSPFYLSHELQTPLHCCLHRDDGVDIVRALLQHGADANIRTSSGNTPLQLALSSGEAAADNIRQLLDAGADPDAKLGNGQVVLHRAAAMGQEDVVQLLCERGADHSLQDYFGRQPYDLALLFNHDSIASLLKPKDQPKDQPSDRVDPPEQDEDKAKNEDKGDGNYAENRTMTDIPIPLINLPDSSPPYQLISEDFSSTQQQRHSDASMDMSSDTFNEEKPRPDDADGRQRRWTSGLSRGMSGLFRSRRRDD